MTTPLTLRVDDETLREIDRLAALTDRSRSYILKAAVARYIEEERQWVDRVARGIEEADKGALVSHEDVMREMRRIAGQETEPAD